VSVRGLCPGSGGAWEPLVYAHGCDCGAPARGQKDCASAGGVCRERAGANELSIQECGNVCGAPIIDTILR
jgi:hypothetical protein